ncbi:hypothetical protein MUN78_02290 [Leucobacter allii]|uniref:DUF2079 domain-containing protein n=1 Tax=Leucobacter allii TaxID=2932247 RepID=A0ABY4FN72_9MICO|nr:DUF6541 family protein [Leucobacter allii]UOQ57696.1 hypothetical protein MUN78_02290 [Leucobacter allii]
MAWLAFALPLGAAIAVIAVLGLPAAFALRLRGLTMLVVAVPAAFAVLAVASILAPLIGMRWSILPALAVAAALAVLLRLLRRWLGAPPRGEAERRRGASSWRDFWIGLGAAAIGGGVIAITLIAAIRTPGAISQTFDVNFHLNAVRYIMDGGSASPFTMDLTSPGQPIFYPTLWHAFVTLVAQLSGAAIPVATNAVLLVVSAVVWPIGALALGRAVAGPGLRVTLITGALLAAFPNFPLFLAGYGVIYPNLFAYALMPFLLVAGLQLLNLGPARRALPMPLGTRWLLLLGALGAAILAHPNVIHGALVWGAVPVAFAAIRALRGRPVPGPAGLLVRPRTAPALRRAGAILGVVAFAAAVVLAWVAGRTTDTAWQGFYGPRSAALQLIGGTPHLEGHAWTVSLLVLLGAVVAWRHRGLRWALGSAAALALFYYIADAFPAAEWRTFFLSPWYNDPRRLAALVPFGALPLAVLGARAGWAMLRPGLRRIAALRPPAARRRALLATFGLLFLLAAGQAGTLSAEQYVRTSYDTRPQETQLLSDDERRLLERLDEEVPAGEVIANDPLNGSALGYALADREVLFPHSGGIYDPRGYELVDSLVGDPAAACEMSRELEVHYVLDFGKQYVLEPSTSRAIPFAQMKHLDRSPILTELDRQGDAVLYHIEGC